MNFDPPVTLFKYYVQQQVKYNYIQCTKYNTPRTFITMNNTNLACLSAEQCKYIIVNNNKIHIEYIRALLVG